MGNAHGSATTCFTTRTASSKADWPVYRASSWSVEPQLRALTPAGLTRSASPFTETVRSNFVMAVNGQAGHGTGEVTASWVGPGHAEVIITPTAPHWLADRPMRSTIILRDDGSVDVQTERVAP